MIRILICTGCEKRLVKCTCTTPAMKDRAPTEEVDLYTEAEVGDFLDKTLDAVLVEHPESAAALRTIRAKGIEGIHPRPKGRARPHPRSLRHAGAARGKAIA